MRHDPASPSLALEQVAALTVTLVGALDAVRIDVRATSSRERIQAQAKPDYGYEVVVFETQARVSWQRNEPLRTNPSTRKQTGLAGVVVGLLEEAAQLRPVELTERLCNCVKIRVSLDGTSVREIRCRDACSFEQMHRIR